MKKSLFRFSSTFQKSAFKNTPKAFYASEEGGLDKTVGIVMTGCGYLDGSEVTEAVSLMVALNRKGYDVLVAGPDGDNDGTFDHASRQPDVNEIRNTRSEISRITRGRVAPLRVIDAERVDGVVFVGGNGVTRLLSDFAEEGQSMTVDPSIEKIIKDFHKDKLPMAFACVSPILPAKVLGTKNGGPGIKVTVGPLKSEAGEAIEAFGNSLVATENAEDVVVDKDNWICSSPAYMLRNANPVSVHDGMSNLVDKFEYLLSGGVESGQEQLLKYTQEEREEMEEMFGKDTIEADIKLFYVEKNYPLEFSKVKQWEKQQQQELLEYEWKNLKIDKSLKDMSPQLEEFKKMKDEFNAERCRRADSAHKAAVEYVKKRAEENVDFSHLRR